MKIEEKKVEPAPDLGPSLDYCSRYDQRRSNDDTSAGANAGSRVKMAFVSANPLTELVWSPQRGLRLKCADCSFTERKQSLPWGVGTSTSHDSMPETDVVAQSCSIVPLDDLNSTLPKNIVNAKSGTIGESTAGNLSIWNTCFIPDPRSSTEEREENGDCPGEMIDKKPPTDVSLINKSVQREEGESREKKKHSPSKVQENSLPESPGQVGCNSINGHISVSFYGDASMEEKETDPNNRVIGMEIVPAYEAEPLNEHEYSDTPVSSRGKGKGKKRTGSEISTLPRLDELEATAENDLQMCNKERTCDVAANVVAPESVPGGKINSVEERKVKRAVAAKDSTGDSRFLQHHSKGKGKALSDGDLSGLPAKEDDDSYESVESCNSAGKFSCGKRRWSFEQQLIVGSKKAKQIEDTPGSSSVAKHGSSFMNWISSMMKGLAKSNQDDEDMLALALSNPDHNRNESMEHSLPMDKETQPLSSRNMGFKSIFQSIYCPNKTAQEATMTLCNKVTGEAPMEIDQIGKRENSVELQEPKENLYESESQNVVGSLTLPHNSFGKFTVSLENFPLGPAKNKNSYMLEEDQAKKTVQSSNASPIMLKANPENDFPLAEERKANDVSDRDGALGSLWIARFSSGASVSQFKQDFPDFQRDQVTVEVNKGISQEFSNVAGNETKDCVSNEGSTGFRQIKDLHDKTLFHSMHEILPFQTVESSDAMASIFARRLDALKNIDTSHLIAGSSRANTTCFFCGIKGHHLQNCSKISEAELEDFVKNVKYYDNVSASPRLCIRCFQLNHWASDCPNALHKEKAESSLPESIPRDRFNRSIKFEEILNGPNMIANVDMKNYSNLSHKGNHLSERQKKTSGNDLRLQIADVPKGIFAALRMLRLSRVDVLKWMHSKISLSHLDGFFLRLRLSKWEEGLGATGYYVACISGMQKERSLKKAKGRISVSIKGIKCMVETQYISNQDFLEDELMAWWCTTSRGSDKIPSEEDLRRKAEEKKKLGF